jgi:hypothetical protein
MFLIASAASAGPASEFWSSYDARNEPLNVESVMEWEDAQGHYQLLRFSLGPLTGSNRSASPVIAAYLLSLR